MSKQQQIQKLELKLAAILAKKVDLDDIPRFVENRVDIYMLCSELWYENYYCITKQLESSINFIKSQLLVEEMLSLNVDLI